MAVINNAYAYRMPAGIPGRPNREWEHTDEPNQLDNTLVPAAFGDAVKMGSNGRIQALVAGDASTAVYGLLEAGFPGVPSPTYGTGNQLLGATAPQAGGRCSVTKRGYMTVTIQGATAAAKGGPVYIRLAGTVPTGGRLNGYEAAADSTNTILLPGAYWMGAADSAGNCEIAYNL
jgi:hypothetical protein